MTTDLTLLSRVAFHDQDITGPRLRGLLALLAGNLRTGCSTARLVEGLWPDEQPENPTKALQVLVSRARSQLGADVIASTPTEYRLSLSESQVDASAVLLSASESAQSTRAGDHLAALEHAEAGLAMWEGNSGRDDAVPYNTALYDPVAALREERMTTFRALVRARALALSRLGRRAEAVEGLAALFREYPHDEEILLELLRCEAATTGTSAALSRYDTYRRRLRDELGTNPGAGLRAVHQELLQSEAPAVRHGVPHEPNPLLGRDDAIAAVTSLLRTSRVTSIVGAGGLGKTRLANVVSRRAEQRVVHFVALAGLTADGDVVGEVASALGVHEAGPGSVRGLAIPTDVLSGIVSALGPGPALLVLDNCEHVTSGAAELVQALVSTTRDLRVLTTSRAPLGLSSESVYLLPELSLATSVELFGQRARAARPGVELPSDVVEELCRHLDGLPLTVELTAARIKVMSASEIAKRLGDRFALLCGGARDTPERHRTLQAVVDWSWNLLDPAGQTALQALSIFPGGFTAAAAQYLLGSGSDGNGDGSDTLEILEHLVDQSLLKVADTPSGTRFRMLETVREFSTTRREAAGDADHAIDGFLAWASNFGAAYHESVFGPDLRASLDRIRADQDNLVQALRLGLTREDGASVAAATAVLGSLWIIENNFTRLVTLTSDTAWTLSHFRPEPKFVDVARAASGLCAAAAFLSQAPRPLRSLVALRRLPPAPTNTLTGAIATLLCAAPEITDPASPVLQALCGSEEPLVSSVANGIASYIWEFAGGRDNAFTSAQRALEMLDSPETPWIRIVARARLGELCLQVGQGEEARRYFQAALKGMEGLGQWPDLVGLRWGMVLASLQLGEVDEAERWLDLAAADHADDRIGGATFSLAARAEVLLARGEAEAGLRMWRQAVDRLKDDLSWTTRADPLTDPWALEVQSAAVVAHARLSRVDLVEELADGLAQKLATALAHPVVDVPPAVESPAHGAVLLALAAIDLDCGERADDEQVLRSAARMTALAQRLRFPENFQPTMSAARARDAAERADRPAYDEAVSSYAGLGLDELRVVALAALRERGQS